MAKVKKEENPNWLKWIAPEKFNDESLFRIVIFFVFHSPCETLSAMGKPLIEYGWSKKPWFKPESLKWNLIANTSNNLNNKEQGKTQFIYSVEKVGDMSQALRKADLEEGFLNNHSFERVVILNSKKNQFMSLFAHIRNSFAHGRLNMIECINENNDCIFLMEDVNSHDVTARIVIRKSTLLRWIDIIEKKRP